MTVAGKVTIENISSLLYSVIFSNNLLKSIYTYIEIEIGYIYIYIFLSL